MSGLEDSSRTQTFAARRVELATPFGHQLLQLERLERGVRVEPRHCLVSPSRQAHPP
jgi:hypothetical protein